jgi:hypothetical protein
MTGNADTVMPDLIRHPAFTQRFLLHPCRILKETEFGLIRNSKSDWFKNFQLPLKQDRGGL